MKIQKVKNRFLSVYPSVPELKAYELSDSSLQLLVYNDDILGVLYKNSWYVNISTCSEVVQKAALYITAYYASTQYDIFAVGPDYINFLIPTSMVIKE